MKGRVLIIAGSDSGGGAGIQADIKTVTALGGYAATAVTAITVQDTAKVHEVHHLPPALIERQVDIVLADIGADAIKVGMIGTLEAGRAVERALLRARGIPVILDPVLVATSGDSLAADELSTFFCEQLVPLTDILTPNLPELAALSGRPVGDASSITSAAHYLLDCGAKAVLAKGGHGGTKTIEDLLVTPSGVRSFKAKRIETGSTHGTGCTLASALATLTAQGMPLEQAAEKAISFVRAAIKSAPGYGRGSGPLNHGAWIETAQDV
jgi:hydroxymethylpyrimidine/phosphomethylpyrimidine kinase